MRFAARGNFFFTTFRHFHPKQSGVSRRPDQQEGAGSQSHPGAFLLSANQHDMTFSGLLRILGTRRCDVASQDMVIDAIIILANVAAVAIVLYAITGTFQLPDCRPRA